MRGAKRHALGKRRHTWKTAPHLEKRATLAKKSHTWKNKHYLVKCVTLE